MIKGSFIGRLGRDAESRHLGNGTPLLSFAVATDEGWGENKTTQWVDCAIFGKRAEGGLGQYLVKGQTVWVTGNISLREHNGKTYMNCRVDDVELAGSPSGSPRQQPPRQQPQKQQPLKGKALAADNMDDLEDDIPF